MAWMRYQSRKSLNECWVETQIFKISLALRNNWIARSGWLRGAPAWENIETRRKIWSTKHDLKPPEMKRMKNDELEAPLESSWESPDKNINGKEWRYFSSMRWYLIKKSESLKKKGGRAGKQRQLGDGWNKHRWENLELLLPMGRMMGSSRREAHRLEKN